MNFFDYIVPFLLILTILVFVHEMGHFLIARYCNVRIEVFSIGFGPEIFGWTDAKGTRWKFSAIPLGGYVKMFGEDDGCEEGGDSNKEGGEKEKAPLTADEIAVSFSHKTIGQRAAIVAGGPLSNFVFAIVVLTGLFSMVGSPSPLAGIGEVQPSSAAEKAGIKVGDKVLSIDGKQIVLFDDLRSIVSANSGVRLKIIVLRKGQKLTLEAIPKPYKVSGGREIGLLGVMPDPKQINYTRHNVIEAAGLAIDRSFGLSMRILSYLGDMITGSRSARNLGGPIRIAKISGEMAKDGILSTIFFLAALSLNLGLINLFPIPMLDGGHLVFYAAEAVRGRPLGPRVQEYSFRFGLILVLLLMVFATWNDLVQLKVFEFIKQLVT